MDDPKATAAVFAISSGDAHLWVADPALLRATGLLSRYARTLSGDEIDRLGGFRFEADRDAVMAAHGLVRVALSWCAPGIAPSAWAFERTSHGRPEIATPAFARTLRFNLSHAHRLVACVVTLGLECGIDVEAIDRPGDLQAITLGVLAPSERNALAAVAERDRRERFLRHWTLKEAYVKACGLGLSLPLDRVAFHLGPDSIRASLDPAVGDAADWRFAQWRHGQGHLVALALRQGAGAAGRIVWHAA